jgi:hypothetical protein
MKYTALVPQEYPDELKELRFQVLKEEFAIELLKFLESQTYPLLIHSFETVIDKHPNLTADEYAEYHYPADKITWEMELGRVNVRRYETLEIPYREMSWKVLTSSAIDEIKRRIKSKFKK